MADEQEELDELDFQIKSGKISAEQVLAWKQLEQQLAQAREETAKSQRMEDVLRDQAQTHLHDIEMMEEDLKNAQHHLSLAKEENAEARALLERVRNVQIGSLSPTLAEEIRAYLAEHPTT